MNNLQAQEHIDECRRMLAICDVPGGDYSKYIGALIIAIDQLATVVEDLANREQGKRIEQ